MEKEISIVIPAYNEQDRLGETIEAIHKFMVAQEWEFEIICVNDGSTDKTFDCILSMMSKHKQTVSVISYHENRGKGYAIRQGLKSAKYPSVLLLDADHSVRIQEMYQFNHLDTPFIYGERKQVKKQPLSRIFFGKGWKLLVWLCTGIYADTQCPFKILRLKKSFYDKLEIDGFAYDVEIFYKLKSMGINGWRVWVKYYNSEDSRVTIKKTYQMFLDLVKMRWDSRKNS